MMSNAISVIPLMDVRRQYASIQSDLDAVVLDVLHSGQYILGDRVEKFEKDVAEYIGVKHAVGVGNGTDALTIALRACGVGSGDEVITTAMSFFSTAEAIVVIGAIPVFVDCLKDTGLIDISLIEDSITNKTKAIIPVHLWGQCVDMAPIKEMAGKHGIRVIEDAAQAIGAEYGGRKAGAIGDAGCISFFPTKNLGAAGDGGMIVTDSEDIYKCALALRAHGGGNNGLYMYSIENSVSRNVEYDFGNNNPKYFNFVTGYNSRLDSLQAAILNRKLSYLSKWNERRVAIAKRYDRGINNPSIAKLKIHADVRCVYYVYIIFTEYRDEMRNYLCENKIGNGVYFPIPLHLQKAFERLGYKKGSMPNAEYIADHSIAIPMYPELEDDEVDRVINVINSWHHL